MKSARLVLLSVVGLELLAVLVLVGWRLSHPQPPAPNLSRLPPQTATAIQGLIHNVWTDSAASWRELGEAFLAFGYCAEAEPCLLRAAQKSPTDFTSVYEHAWSLERLGRHAEANEEFSRAAALGTKRQAQDCQTHIARNSLRLDRLPEAEQAFAACLDLPAAQVERARMLVRTGRSREALPVLERVRASYDDLSIRTEMIAVQAFREQHQPAEAARAVERADRAREHDRIANPLELLDPIRQRYGLYAALRQGEELDQAGQRREAAVVFQRVLDETPIDFLELILQTGARLDLLNQSPKAALAKFDRLAARMDVAPESKLIWGMALAKVDRVDEAVALWKQAVAAQPLSQLHFSLSQGLAAAGDQAGAEKQLRAGRLQQAIDAYRANQLDAALGELTALRTVMAGNPRYHYFLGLVLSASGKTEQARQAYSRCLELDPAHGFASYHLKFLAGETEPPAQ